MIEEKKEQEIDHVCLEQQFGFQKSQSLHLPMDK
jgi:hypothetical protein